MPPLGTKPRKQEIAEQDNRAVRRAATPLEYSPDPVESCARLHLSHTVQQDGTPEYHPAFLGMLNASVNEQRRRREEVAERAALLAPRDWCTPAELAALLGIHQSTITRAIARKELRSTRPGGVYGRHRIAWPDATAYLTDACGCSEEEARDVRVRWAQTCEVYP